MDLIIRISDVIKNFETPVDIELIENTLVIDKFQMRLQDLTNELNEIKHSGEDMIETPILPKNCVKHVWHDMGKQEHSIFIEIPKQQWTISFEKDKYENVGFPRLIFKYYIKHKSVSFSKIFALKGNSFLEDDTELFLFPYSHVDQSGNVCMGSNVLPSIREIQQVGMYHVLFFQSPFSTDYGAKNTKGMQVEQLFKEMQHKEFPDDWLLPANRILKEIY
ncbi:hypothetical protein [Bacillus swezeyi]|uniref:PRTRC system protein B n=1 Tax=Bacillus swezeyi TaxID=1925020 RepID=A0A5M8RM37_9BACI|nr:hypothetical protein [Bacillus swezeyi]KAA6447002.1 hypothetical protein DX927_23455 [Bacillus swezeyi]KAA6471570.1 hypothetical protein DX928_23695 [Bacillus swezeyi]